MEKLTVFKYLGAFYMANWLDGSKGKMPSNPWRLRETDRFSVINWNIPAFFLNHSPKIKSGNSEGGEVLGAGHI